MGKFHILNHSHLGLAPACVHQVGHGSHFGPLLQEVIHLETQNLVVCGSFSWDHWRLPAFFLNIHGPYQLGCSLILTSFQGHIHCSWWHLNLVTVYSLSSHSFLKYHVCSHPWPLVLSEDRVPPNLMVQTLRKRIVPLTLPWIEGKSGSFQTYLYHSLD
jgi:hypothetical protein